MKNRIHEERKKKRKRCNNNIGVVGVGGGGGGSVLFQPGPQQTYTVPYIMVQLFTFVRSKLNNQATICERNTYYFAFAKWLVTL